MNANIVVTRDTIYERIWGYEFETSSKSLDVYIGYLRRKTEADGEPRLIRTIRGVGYTLRDGMSLRLRLTLVVAVTFALVVVGCIYAAHVSAKSRLRAETDEFLLQRSARFAHTQPNQFPDNGKRPTTTVAAAAAVPRSPIPTRSCRSSTPTATFTRRSRASPRCRSTRSDRAPRGSTAAIRDSATSR